MAITVLELAQFRGAKETADGGYTMGSIEDTGLPFMGGCGRCGATVAAYNAAPSKRGYLMCAEGCVGSEGFDSVEEANRFIFPQEYEWQGCGHKASDLIAEEGEES